MDRAAPEVRCSRVPGYPGGGQRLEVTPRTGCAPRDTRGRRPLVGSPHDVQPDGRPAARGGSAGVGQPEVQRLAGCGADAGRRAVDPRSDGKSLWCAGFDRSGVIPQLVGKEDVIPATDVTGRRRKRRDISTVIAFHPVCIVRVVAQTVLEELPAVDRPAAGPPTPSAVSSTPPANAFHQAGGRNAVKPAASPGSRAESSIAPVDPSPERPALMNGRVSRELVTCGIIAATESGTCTAVAHCV